MNRGQRIIAVVGMGAVMIVAMFPVWEVVADLRLDYEIKSEDSGKVSMYSEAKTLTTTERRFLFAPDEVPESLRSPEDRRVHDPKAGFSTVTCVATEVQGYSYTIDALRLMLEMLVAALPMLVLIVVFISPRK